MCLVHKQLIDTQFLKGNHIILAALVVQLCHPRFQALSGFLQLLNGVAFPILGLCFLNAVDHLVDLLLEDGFLTFRRKRDFFKLAMSNHDRVIVAGGNPAAKLFSVRRFKILFGGHQHIGSGIEPQKIRAPLFGQMVWNHH